MNLSPNKDGIQLFLPFNEGSGNTTNSHNGNNCSLVNSPIWNKEKDGSYSIKFNGTNQYIDSGYAPDITTTQSITHGVWFKSTGTTITTQQPLFTSFKETGTNDTTVALTLTGVTTGGVFFQLRDGTGAVSTVDTDGSVYDYRDGIWHLAVGVRDAVSKKIKIYIDGELKAKSDDNTIQTISLSDNNFFIGASNVRGSFGDGLQGYIRLPFTLLGVAWNETKIKQFYKDSFIPSINKQPSMEDVQDPPASSGGGGRVGVL